MVWGAGLWPNLVRPSTSGGPLSMRVAAFFIKKGSTFFRAYSRLPLPNKFDGFINPRIETVMDRTPQGSRLQ